jgi:mono/diheme cytochrome c family protein
MKRTTLFMSLLLFSGAVASAWAQTDGNATRGKLLYTTHCGACHSSSMHWRDKKLATDMDSLRIQVRRWQNNTKLDWTEDEIEDVVHYLNAVYYKFPETDRKSRLEESQPSKPPA